MRKILAVALILAALAGLGLVLAGCESSDNAAARRLSEESARVRAEAEAYQVRAAADSAAASERASVRQMERDASHQRTVEMLPFVVAIGGGVLLLVLAGLVVWDLRSRQAARAPAPTLDPVLIDYLNRLQLEQSRQWRVLAHMARVNRDAGEVVIYDGGIARRNALTNE